MSWAAWARRQEVLSYSNARASPLRRAHAALLQTPCKRSVTSHWSILDDPLRLRSHDRLDFLLRFSQSSNLIKYESHSDWATLNLRLWQSSITSCFGDSVGPSAYFCHRACEGCPAGLWWRSPATPSSACGSSTVSDPNGSEASHCCRAQRKKHLMSYIQQLNAVYLRMCVYRRLSQRLENIWTVTLF